MNTSMPLNALPVEINELPAVAQDLVDLIGLAATLRLVEAYGGITFRVSLGARAAGKTRYALLAEVVGKQAADKITARYALTGLYVPICADALRRARDRAICAEFGNLTMPGSDMSGRDAVFTLARKYRLSDRAVWGILKVTDMTVTSDRKRDQATLF